MTPHRTEIVKTFVIDLPRVEIIEMLFIFPIILQAMMDRKKKDELPKIQVGFIDAICMPVYKVWYFN